MMNKRDWMPLFLAGYVMTLWLADCATSTPLQMYEGSALPETQVVKLCTFTVHEGGVYAVDGKMVPGGRDWVTLLPGSHTVTVQVTWAVSWPRWGSVSKLVDHTFMGLPGRTYFVRVSDTGWRDCVVTVDDGAPL